MSIAGERRIVLPEGMLLEGDLELPRDVASHARDVLRLKTGDFIRLTDGAGSEARAEIVHVARRIVRVRVGGVERSASPLPLEVTLLQCVGKGDKMDSVVRQATELGVSAIVPVISERAVVRHKERVERWRAVAEDAVRVSGRSVRPRIEPVVPFDEILGRIRAPLAVCLALDAEKSLGEDLESRGAAHRGEVLIGPEGGLTKDELARAAEAGFSRVHFGRFTLRTETAGPAVLAVLLYWAGRREDQVTLLDGRNRSKGRGA